MRKVILLAAASAMIGSEACSAADIYAGAPGGGLKDEPVYAVNSWAGFYLGTNGGGAWTSQDGSLNINTKPVGGGSYSAGAKASPAGVFGGAQAGYNWQAGSWVLGVEADIDAAHVYDKPATTLVSPASTSAGVAGKSELVDFGTARLRAGYSFGQLLVFGSGGFAFGNVQDRFGASFADGAAGTTSSDRTATGWAAGAGFQYAFTPAVSWKLEYLHIDHGSTTISQNFPLPSATASLTVHHDYDIVRTGINYRLGTDEPLAITEAYHSVFGNGESLKDAPAPLLMPWGGYYAGVNTASAYADNEGRLATSATAGGVTGFGGVNESPSGWAAGGQIGYNWQYGRFVLGVEADADGATGIQDRAFNSVTQGVSITQASAKSDLDYFGTLRARAGYSLGRVLVYGTGGFAFGGVQDRLSVTNINGPTGASSVAANSNSETATGWTAGGGVEIAFTPNWSLKTEYLHLALGSTTLTESAGAGGGASGTASLTVHHDYDVIRGGVNYHFGNYEPLK